eukprot:6201280-Pleurochrysis_carterae.AAC.8
MEDTMEKREEGEAGSPGTLVAYEGFVKSLLVSFKQSRVGAWVGGDGREGSLGVQRAGKRLKCGIKAGVCERGAIKGAPYARKLRGARRGGAEERP